MKGKVFFLVSVFFSGLLGWSLGFLRLPYIEKNNSFWIGFLACLASLVLVYIFLLIWKKNTFLQRSLSTSASKNENFSPTKTNNFIWILVSSFIVFGGLMSSYLISQRNQIAQLQLQFQNEKIAQQTEMMESVKRSNSIVLINQLAESIERDLNNNPKGELSDAMINRITALNHSFHSNQYFERDSSSIKLSIERGQLLFVLSKMEIDSNTFNKIKMTTSFLAADLRNANLENVDLSGADLRNANFTSANLSGANFEKADLRSANFWGTNLNGAKYSELGPLDGRSPNEDWGEV